MTLFDYTNSHWESLPFLIWLRETNITSGLKIHNKLETSAVNAKISMKGVWHFNEKKEIKELVHDPESF